MKRRLVCLLLALCLLPLPAGAAGERITRGEFLLLLWAESGSVPFDKTAHPFSDLQGRDDLAQAAAWGYSLGLVRGVGDGLFAPGRPLTRTECAVLLRRNDARLGREVWFPEGAALCNDFEGVEPWSGDDLYWACGSGRMGWREGRLCPQGMVSPEEAREYLER